MVLAWWRRLRKRKEHVAALKDLRQDLAGNVNDMNINIYSSEMDSGVNSDSGKNEQKRKRKED